MFQGLSIDVLMFIASVLAGINVYFIKRLMEKIDSTHATSTKTNEELIRFNEVIKFLNMDVSEAKDNSKIHNVKIEELQFGIHDCKTKINLLEAMIVEKH